MPETPVQTFKTFGANTVFFPSSRDGRGEFFIAMLYLARRTIHYRILNFFSIKKATNGKRALFSVRARIPACV